MRHRGQQGPESSSRRDWSRKASYQNLKEEKFMQNMRPGKEQQSLFKECAQSKGDSEENEGLDLTLHPYLFPARSPHGQTQVEVRGQGNLSDSQSL